MKVRNTKRHNLLVRKVLREMMNKGFTDFYREVRVDTNRRIVFVDLVIAKGNKIIAIECGDTSMSKLNTLMKYFSDVWWYRYDGCVEKYKGRLTGNAYGIIEKHKERKGLSYIIL